MQKALDVITIGRAGVDLYGAQVGGRLGLRSGLITRGGTSTAESTSCRKATANIRSMAAVDQSGHKPSRTLSAIASLVKPGRLEDDTTCVGSAPWSVHRILLRGGLLMYPSTSDAKPGKLRLLYEANPMSMILEAAGGLAFDGGKRILAIDPTGIHQRVGVIMDSRTEVSEVRGYLADQT
ncbi:hypothetical protein K538_12165 [Agrobacterium tumefaciens GW4]|nr:hypothetical protein K538_12165 [Agrobacterium tumefaciens GW4]